MPVLALLLSVAPAGWPGYGGPTADFCVPALPAGTLDPAAVRWRRPLGPGESGLAVADGRLVTAYSVPDPKDGKRGEEVVTALNPATGKTLWERRDPVAMRDKQQSFDGPVRPRATPLLRAGRVFAVGFAGRLLALDAATGNLLWQSDLVADHGAEPVQFGFSGSPVGYKDVVLVHAGGKKAAVIAFDPATGAVRWKTEPAAPGYATPVVAAFDGEDQVVQLTRDAVFGFAAADGATRWRYALPLANLTNVPTPLVLPGGKVLVSGQGVKGTRLLAVGRDGDTFKVEQLWHNQSVQFFYCNWVADGPRVVGCVGKEYGALRLADGEVLWQTKALGDANTVLAGGTALALRGDGRLGRYTLAGDDEMREESAVKLLAGRTWTAPTVVGDRLYARDGAEVVCVDLAAGR